MRTLFVLPNLEGGGSEKFTLNLIQGLGIPSDKCALAVFEKKGELLDLLPPGLRLIEIGGDRLSRRLWNWLKLVWKEKPGTIYSTAGQWNVFFCLLRFLYPARTRILIRQSQTFSEVIRHEKRPKLWLALYRLSYPLASRVICQTKAMEEDLRKSVRLREGQAIVIYNAVDFDGILRRAKESASPFVGAGPHLLTVGTLSKKKGHDRVLRMLPLWAKKHSGLKLTLLGEGPEKENLTRLARELGVLDRVHFAGFSKDPVPYFAHADLFLLPSRYEGLPNVLLEAIAAGCPVWAMAHPGGTLEAMTMFGLEGHYFEAFPDDLVLPKRRPRIHPDFARDGILEKYALLFDSLMTPKI